MEVLLHKVCGRPASRTMTLRAAGPEDAAAFYALQNDCVKFGNTIICGARGWCVDGSPDFKEQDRKIYLRETERLKLSTY